MRCSDMRRAGTGDHHPGLLSEQRRDRRRPGRPVSVLRLGAGSLGGIRRVSDRGARMLMGRDGDTHPADSRTLPAPVVLAAGSRGEPSRDAATTAGLTSVPAHQKSLVGRVQRQWGAAQRAAASDTRRRQRLPPLPVRPALLRRERGDRLHPSPGLFGPPRFATPPRRAAADADPHDTGDTGPEKAMPERQAPRHGERKGQV